MMKWYRTVSLGLACALLLGASEASAQIQRRQRPADGLFGGPTPSPNSQQQLDVSAALYGGYDDDVTADQGGLAPAAAGIGGVFSGVNMGLSYNRRLGRKVAFGASAGTSVRYYPSLEGNTLAPIGQQVGAGFTIGDQKNSRNRLTVGGDASFFPYYSLSLVPVASPPLEVGELAPQPVDSVVNKRESIAYGTGVTFEHELGPRSAFTLNYGYHTIDFHEESRRQSTQSAGVHFRRGMTKNLGLKFGYERADSYFGRDFNQVANHIIDAGLDFNKPLSLTRRTTLTFSIGPSLLQQNGVWQYRAVGDVALNHEIGRTWAARATYHRGVGLVPGLGAPMFSNGFGLGLDGLLTRRLEFNALASFSTGDFAITGANNYDSYQGSVGLRAALQRSTAVFVEYIAYRYRFDSRVFLPIGLPGTMNRQGIRAGLTLWLPLIR